MNNIFNKAMNWLFRDDNNKVVLAQFPNWQLIGALVTWSIQFIVADGTFHIIMRAVFTALIVFWAYAEIVHGVNGFRRILGALILALICVNLYTTLAVT